MKMFEPGLYLFFAIDIVLVWMPLIKLEDHEDKPRKQGVLNLKLPGLLFLKAQFKVRGDLRNILPWPHQTLYGSICVGCFCRGY
jgi:hypothetical protein